MTRKRARSVDQRSFWALGTAKPSGELRRPPVASTQTAGMLAFAPIEGFIRRMSAGIKAVAGGPLVLRR
jgi:hypothetical protein